MPKYRILSSEELELLEKEFIEFLVINGITADEWQKIKASEPEKTKKFIELFSDVVFEKLMRKTKYVIKQVGTVLMCFYYDDEEAKMILVQDWHIDKPLGEITKADITKGQFSISLQSKKYQKTRELELFQMIQGGAEVSDGKIYELLIDNG